MALPQQLKTARMTNSTAANTIDNEVGNVEQAIADILGVTVNTDVNPGDTRNDPLQVRYTDDVYVTWGGGNNGITGSEASAYVKIKTNNTVKFTMDSAGVMTLTSHINFSGTGTYRVATVDAGNLDLQTNDTSRIYISSGGNVGIGTSTEFGSGVGVISILERATPPSTNPTGAGILYVESGQLRYRGTSGTVTTIAVA